MINKYPMRMDESIHLQLREKYGDKMLRMQKGDPQVYEELFSYSCPKFLSPMDNVHPNYHKEPFLQQLKVFSNEVQQQAHFLKLYTTMPVAKLAGFLDLTEQEFRIQLLVFKHKMKNLVWTSGISTLDGEFQSASEVDFYINKDMIHTSDTKVARRRWDSSPEDVRSGQLEPLLWLGRVLVPVNPLPHQPSAELKFIQMED
uniref:PCI domain-containing protein n=1 Tax=Cavia porcellus TaxID=10141 RepID=A0A286Y4J6_CAVPO